MKTVACLVLTLVLVALAPAQEPSPPTTSQTPAAKAFPNSALGDISGMYTFLREGEFLQIDLEDDGSITGFVSRYGDLESDKDAFLDHIIKQGSLQGNKLSFTTRAVHGVSFEFQGIVDRGEGKTTSVEGYYVLKGKLIQTTTDANKNATAKSRDVVLKSFPSDVQAEPAKAPVKKNQ